jgi:ParB family chromosome partitioning protein
MTTQTETLPIAEIHPNPGQPRKLFDQDKLDELAASIEQHGLLQPITVRPAGGHYVIVAGERRWRAAQQAGLMFIPAQVADVSEDDAFVLAILENVVRADMTVIEEAEAFQQLTATGRTPADVAALFGKTTDYVTWRIGMLGLDQQHRRHVETGTISLNLAYQAAQLSPAGQQLVIRKAMRGGFPSDSDAVAFAKAVRHSEGQGFFLEVQEMVERQRAEQASQPGPTEPAPADPQIAALDDATRVLNGILDMGKPNQIATELGLRTAEYLDAVLDLADAARAARLALRKANALIEVASGADAVVA